MPLPELNVSNTNENLQWFESKLLLVCQKNMNGTVAPRYPPGKLAQAKLASTEGVQLPTRSGPEHCEDEKFPSAPGRTFFNGKKMGGSVIWETFLTLAAKKKLEVGHS